MSGFVARTEAAVGAHDPLSVRALVVDGTGVVTVDVVGLDEDTCRRIRERCGDVGDVVVHATHTHGGPVSMRDRLGDRLDEDWLRGLEDAAVDAVHEAAARREPADLAALSAPDPDVARNRRRPDGPVDRELPVVLLRRPDGTTLATVVSYACHPVVLGADNLRFTADYPGVVRSLVEDDLGGVTLFLTGCAGDANTGHTAAASVTTAPTAGRTYAASAEVGARIARAVLDGVRHRERVGGVADAASDPASAAGPRAVSAVRREVVLALDVPSPEQLRDEATRWAESARAATDEAQRALFRSWAGWAATAGAAGVDRWHGQVTVLRWGPATLVCLPGEPFAATARAVRAVSGPGVTLVAGYCDGCPGYLPPAEEYPYGGYEVEDAHRYYGMPGPFAPGSAERLVAAVEEIAAAGR